MPRYSAIVTVLAVVFYFFIATRVGVARQKFGVKLPAIAGHPDFERVFRVHMNTLEWMPIFLPALWVFAVYCSPAWAAGFGVLWLVGRIVYFAGYRAAAKKRASGFFIQSIAVFALSLGALGRIAYLMVTVH